MSLWNEIITHMGYSANVHLTPFYVTVSLTDRQTDLLACEKTDRLVT